MELYREAITRHGSLHCMMEYYYNIHTSSKQCSLQQQQQQQQYKNTNDNDIDNNRNGNSNAATATTTKNGDTNLDSNSNSNMNNANMNMDNIIQVPTLVLLGEYDTAFQSTQLCVGLENYVSDKFMLVLLDGGHYIQEEIPNEVNYHILNFLRKHTKR